MDAYIDLIRPIAPCDYRDRLHGHFLYDSVSAEILDDMPFFGRSRVTAYAVRIANDGADCATGTLGPVMIERAGQQGWIELHLDYRAWVLQQNAADLVRACAGAAHPGLQLARHVVHTVQQVVARAPDAFDRADPNALHRLQHEASELLLRQLGLKAILNFRVDEELSAPLITVETAVHTADYPQSILLRFEVETYLRNRERPMAKVALSQRPPRYLEELVEQVGREVMREIPTAHVRIGLDDTERERLRERLAIELAASYIRARAVRATLCAPLPEPPRALDLELTVECEPRGYPRKAQVRARVHLQLSDEAVYWRAKAPDLSLWAEGEAKREMSRALSSVTYSQLCLSPSRWEPVMQRALEHAAAAIGYRIHAELRGPSTDATRLLRPFLIELDEEYATKLSDVRTRLAVALQLRLESTEPILWHIDHDVDVRDSIRNAVHHEIAAYIHTTHPGHLFLHFHTPASLTQEPTDADREPLEQNTLHAVLHSRVERALREKFGIEALSFTLKLGSSELRSIHDSLLSAETIEFRVQARPPNFTAPVSHCCALEVREIRPEDWTLFQRKKPSPEAVALGATRAMQALIDEKSSSQQLSLSSDHLRDLAYVALPERLRTELGVSVRCFNWRCEHNSEDHQAWQEYNRFARDIRFAELRTEHEVNSRHRLKLIERALALRLAGEVEEAEELEHQAEQLRLRGSTSVEVPRREQHLTPPHGDQHD